MWRWKILCGDRFVSAAVASAIVRLGTRVHRRPYFPDVWQWSYWCDDSLCSAAVDLTSAAVDPTFFYMYFKFSFIVTGKRTTYESKKPNEKDLMVYIGLECKGVERVGGYRLHGGEGEKYPTRQEALQPAPSTSSGESSAAPPPAQSEEMLVKMHRELVKMASSLGVPDLCAADKRSRPENILEGVTRENLVCKFCNKKLSSVTHLKNHRRKLHLRQTAHKCSLCNKFFSEAFTLRRHIPMYDKAAQKFKCNVKVQKKKDGPQEECGKEFPSQGKLLDHQDVHAQAKLQCKFCKKPVSKRQRGLNEHQESCDQNPNRKPNSVCRLCRKEFTKRKSMLRHFRSAHPGEDPDV